MNNRVRTVKEQLRHLSLSTLGLNIQDDPINK